MKEILGFHLIGCPYCENAFRAIDELVAENPAYADIHINWVEDQDAHELFKTWIGDTNNILGPPYRMISRIFSRYVGP